MAYSNARRRSQSLTQPLTSQQLFHTHTMAMLCTVCGKLEVQFCKQCKSARYCSKACQKVDWPIHKRLCAEFARFQTTSRPSHKHVRGILFSAKGTDPKFIWLQCERVFDDAGQVYLSPVLPKHLNTGPDVYPLDCPIPFNPFGLRPTGSTFFFSPAGAIHLCYRDTLLADDFQNNENVSDAVTTR
jgi:hypothetical protein